MPRRAQMTSGSPGRRTATQPRAPEARQAWLVIAYWSPKGAIVADAFAVLNGVGEADVPDEGASLGSTTAVGFGGMLGVAAGQATTIAKATTRAVSTPARAPRMSCIRPNMP